jgi:hypothetical protein
MPEPWLRFPVVCPECRNEELGALPLGMVADALVTGNPVRLYVSCHDIYWAATAEEMRTLRRALATMNSGAVNTPAPAPDGMKNTGIRRTGAPPQLTAPR